MIDILKIDKLSFSNVSRETKLNDYSNEIIEEIVINLIIKYRKVNKFKHIEDMQTLILLIKMTLKFVLILIWSWLPGIVLGILMKSKTNI